MQRKGRGGGSGGGASRGGDGRRQLREKISYKVEKENKKLTFSIYGLKEKFLLTQFIFIIKKSLKFRKKFF